MYKYTSKALGTLVLTEKQCFQWLPKTTVFNVVSQFVWKRVPDDWSGDRKCATAECTVLMTWHVQLATRCWAQSLTTGDVAKLQLYVVCCEQMGPNSGLHIIIFDEIDAICKARGSVAGSTAVHDTVVNQLLSKIDGVDQLNNILVIGLMLLLIILSSLSCVSSDVWFWILLLYLHHARKNGTAL